MIPLRKRRAFFALLLWLGPHLAVPTASAAGAGEGLAPLRHRMETRHTVIYYERPEDLRILGGKIEYSSEGWYLDRLYRPGAPQNFPVSLKRKIDAVFERVRQILDMRKNIQKVSIHAYHDKARLHEAYSRLTGRDCPVRAWYIYEIHTIFINVEDVNEGILAHEMAHAIIDHYFTARPPEATAEILARYVDQHLHTDRVPVGTRPP